VQINGQLTIRDGNPIGSTLTIGDETLRDGGIGFLRVASNFTPDGDNIYKLGGSANRWTEVWSVNGTIQTSDIRRKKHVEDLSYGLETVMQMCPVSYQWIDGSQEVKLGLIAQEVLGIVPEVVHTGDDSDLLGLNYADLIPVLIRAIQELKEENNQMKASIATLRR
jgi:hypothetical protein